MADSESVPVKTYVPPYQKERWREHADRLGMSQSEFVRTMVQAGRRDFEVPAAPTEEPAESPSSGLEPRVKDALSAEEHRSWDDLLAAVDDVGDRLAGVLFNRIDDAVYDDVDQDVIPFLTSRGVETLGALPRSPELAGVTVSALADELGAEVLVEGDGDALVQRFSVGAMGAEEALRHFRRARDAAVITGGDRSDIATAAVEANSVRCLVLTGGHRPSGSVLGKAKEAGLPVLSVASDTLTTVDRAEDVIRSGRTRDARTVEVMRELLETHADVDALLGPGGD